MFLILINTFTYTQGQDTILWRKGEVVYTESQTKLDSIASSVKQNLTRKTTPQNGADDRINIAIYFRWDKDNIDPTYLTNANTLHVIDSILSCKSARYIDTLYISAFASPEGLPTYNQKLSQRRAQSFKEYLLKKYPNFTFSTVRAQGEGENWEGFRAMAQADPNLPRKNEILSIVDNPELTLVQRQAKIARLDAGRVYREYIYPRYFPDLRSAVSLFVVYNSAKPIDEKLELSARVVIEPKPGIEINPKGGQEALAKRSSYRYIYPLALKTNLLFDAATLFNVELEVPIGRHLSVLGEWTFPFWGGLANRAGVAPIPVYSDKYTLQMLSGGVELRYWFNGGDKSKDKTKQCVDYNALCGWFVGPYVGRGLYDFQLGKDGVQGDFYIAAGISGGFAHSIGKYLHMEYSMGVGYMKTQYQYYTPMDGHKVYQHDGKYTWIGPTKAKISLVWMPGFRINSNKGGVK